MSTKSAIDTFMSALKSARFDVQFLGITVGKADSWAITEDEEGTIYFLYFGFRGPKQVVSHDIAVDFESGVVYPFEETDEDYNINFYLPHDMAEMIKESV